MTFIVRVLHVREVVGGVGCLTDWWNQVGPLKKDLHGRGWRGRGGDTTEDMGSLCKCVEGQV